MASSSSSSISTSSTSKVVTSAVAIIPPEDVWSQIQEIRKVHDKSYKRWMPHINLLYPFVPFGQFPSAFEALTEVTKDFPPFTVEISQFQFFQHRQSSTLFLEPEVWGDEDETDSQNTIKVLQQRLESVFPHCDDLSTKSDDGYHPHLTVGSFKDLNMTKKVMTEASSKFQPITFVVENIYMISREQDGPFTIKHTLPLRGTKKASLTLSKLSLKNPSKKPHIAKTTYKKHAPVGLPVYKFSIETQQWETAAPTSSDIHLHHQGDSIVITTYNVLFDLYFTDQIYTSERIPRLVSILKETHSDIIGLQEVTVSFLTALLQEDWVRSNYFVSDNGTGSSWPTDFGQVLLSNKPFALSTLALSRSKSALIGEFSISEGCKRLFVPVVHLTSSLNANAQKKSMQFNQVLSAIPPDTDIVMIGDFNIEKEEESSIAMPRGYVDAWRSLRPTEEGNTFDPTTNSIAKIISHTQQPRRFDRVLYLNLNTPQLVPHNIELIGTTGFEVTSPQGEQLTMFPSDHFGLRCTFSFNISFPSPNPTHDIPAASLATLPHVELSNEALKASLTGFCQFESEVEALNRRRALKNLKSLLSVGVFSQFFDEKTFWLVPIGSYHLGVHTRGSDIDLLCVADVSRSDFFRLAIKQLTSAAYESVVIQAVESAIAPTIRLRVCGYRIDLLYCSVTKKLDRKSSIYSLNNQSMDVKSLTCLNGFRDSEVIYNLLNEGNRLESFRTAYHLLKKWAELSGIYSNKFGFLGGYALSIMLLKVCLQLPTEATSAAIVEVFFNVYAHWNWRNPIAVYVSSSYKPQAQFPLSILTLCKPQKNCSRNATRATQRVLEDNIRKTHQALARGERSVTDILAHIQERQLFFEMPSYLQIEIMATTMAEHYAWVGCVESRIVDLIVKIEQRYPHLQLRPWPKRYTRANTEEHQYQNSFYLIGIASNNELEQTIIEEFVRATEAFFPQRTPSMRLVVRQLDNEQVHHLLASMEEDDSIETFNSSSIHILDHAVPNGGSATTTSSTAASSTNPTDANDALAKLSKKEQRKEFKKNNPKLKKSNRGQLDPDEEITIIPGAGRIHTAPAPLAKPKETTKRGKGKIEVMPKKKLRTSEEVYNRIKWDKRFDPSDYILIYEDRFLGMKEIGFVEFRAVDWEESIPFHRVWFFKRISDGKIMWDRANRLDFIFEDDAE